MSEKPKVVEIRQGIYLPIQIEIDEIFVSLIQDNREIVVDRNHIPALIQVLQGEVEK
jgi:hypothetical protein